MRNESRGRSELELKMLDPLVDRDERPGRFAGANGSALPFRGQPLFPIPRRKATRSRRSEFIMTRKEESWCVTAAPTGPITPVAAKARRLTLKIPAKRMMFCHAVLTALGG